MGLPGVLQIESAAMHIRKILEPIVFGSLVTNRREVEAVAKAFHKADVEDARKLARRVNSHYWPTPLAPYEGVALPEIAQHRPLEGVEYLRERTGVGLMASQARSCTQRTQEFGPRIAFARMRASLSPAAAEVKRPRPARMLAELARTTTQARQLFDMTKR